MAIVILFIVLFISTQVTDCLVVSSEESNLTWTSLESKAKSAIRSLVRSSLPTILRSMADANVSSDCERGLMAYSIALMKLKIWAVEMIDATAKFPSGVMSGTLMDFGEFDQCLKIRVPEPSKSGKEGFRGRYCTIRFQSHLLIASWRKRNGDDNAYEPPELVQKLLNNSEDSIKSLGIILGVCIPSLCSGIDLQSISAVFTKPLGVTPSVVDCHVDEPFVWPSYSVVAVSALVVLAAICTIGTTLDVFTRREKENSATKKRGCISSVRYENALVRVLKAFSILANSEKLFRGSDSNDVSCLHGIRFLSATWIVLGHTYIYFDVWMNEKYRHRIGISEYFGSYISSAIIENFTLSVDTFFFISGFLLVNSTWKRLKTDEGKLNLLTFFVRKYWRMTPALCFAMTLLMAMPVIDSGPLWHSALNPYIKKCQENWWMSFLYISNWPAKNVLCLGHTWYLSTLMQCHILGVVVLITLYRSRIFGIILGSLFAAICATTIAIQVLWGNYPLPTVVATKDTELILSYLMGVYLKPQSHLTCYMIGMAAAYMLVEHKDKKLAPKYQALGWVVAVGVALFSLVGLNFHEDSGAYVLFYHVVFRPAWGMSVAWLTYMCASGSGGLVNRILSLRMMCLLSQLSYLTYLIHILVIIYKNACQRERIYFGHTAQVFQFFSTLVATLLLAFIGCVAVEIPFQILDQMIFRSKPKAECTTIECRDKPLVTCSMENRRDTTDMISECINSATYNPKVQSLEN